MRRTKVSCGALAKGTPKNGYIYAAQRTQKALDRLNAWANTIHDVNPDTVNWGHVGTLEHYASMLEDVLSAINGKD